MSKDVTILLLTIFMNRDALTDSRKTMPSDPTHQYTLSSAFVPFSTYQFQKNQIPDSARNSENLTGNPRVCPISLLL